MSDNPAADAMPFITAAMEIEVGNLDSTTMIAEMIDDFIESAADLDVAHVIAGLSSFSAVLLLMLGEATGVDPSIIHQEMALAIAEAPKEAK